MNFSARSRAIAALTTVIVLAAANARGQNYWNVASGNWAIPSNWSAGEPGSNMNNANAYAYITNNGTATVNSPVATCYTLTLGNGVGTSGAVQLTSGGQLSGTGLSIGTPGQALGLFVQAGGTNTWTANFNLGAVGVFNGSYDLSAGLLTTNNVSVEYETSVFTQSGGTDQAGPADNSPVSGTAGMVLDVGGTYNLVAGQLSVAGGETIGNTPGPALRLFRPSRSRAEHNPFPAALYWEIKVTRTFQAGATATASIIWSPAGFPRTR